VTFQRRRLRVAGEGSGQRPGPPGLVRAALYAADMPADRQRCLGPSAGSAPANNRTSVLPRHPRRHRRRSHRSLSVGSYGRQLAVASSPTVASSRPSRTTQMDRRYDPFRPTLPRLLGLPRARSGIRRHTRRLESAAMPRGRRPSTPAHCWSCELNEARTPAHWPARSCAITSVPTDETLAARWVRCGCVTDASASS